MVELTDSEKAMLAREVAADRYRFSGSWRSAFLEGWDAAMEYRADYTNAKQVAERIWNYVVFHASSDSGDQSVDRIAKILTNDVQTKEQEQQS